MTEVQLTPPVVDTTGWGEASQDPTTFSKGGAASRLGGKTGTIVGLSGEIRPIGGTGRNAHKFKAYADLVVLADGETETVTQQFDAGDPQYVQLTADRSAFLTKNNRLSGSTQWAEFLDAANKAGFKAGTPKFAELIGQRFDFVAVEKKYDAFTTADGETVAAGSATRLSVTKYQGKATNLPQIAAPAAGPVAVASGTLEEQLTDAVIQALAEAPGNKLKVNEVSKAVQALVKIEKTKLGSVVKTLLSQEFYAKVPGVTFDKDTATVSL